MGVRIQLFYKLPFFAVVSYSKWFSTVTTLYKSGILVYTEPTDGAGCIYINSRLHNMIVLKVAIKNNDLRSL